MIKHYFSFILVVFSYCQLNAQDDFSYKSATYKYPMIQSGIFGENASEIIQWGDQNEAPKPAGNYYTAKQQVNKLRERYYQNLNKTNNYKSTPAEIAPKIDTSFDGQITGSRGIPNDNHLAISNGGKIVSVQNSSIRVLDENGKSLLYKTLFQFANGKILGFTNYCYDPKVVYDPLSDRFILFFLHESKVASNFGVLAFSKTNDPAGEWNFYKLPGNALNNDKWSDYPIMAISKEDVFITLNLLTENTDWRDGFNQSLIWQIKKQNGYNGDTLIQKVYSDIRYKSKAIWSICPVQGGFTPTHPNMYFLSVRPGDLENDTLFLHEINNTLQSNKASLSLKILKTDKTYGVPPVAPQPKGGDTLQTNDTRVLSGIYHFGKIQYVQTSVVKPYYRSGVFHGMFDVNKSEVKANFISADSIDYGYPSIAYAGKGAPSDQASAITFSHVSSKSFPGTSAVYHTQIANLPSYFSDVVRVKSGVKVIERLPFNQVSQERWGDYTGIQNKYNEPGTMWVVGSFGNVNSLNGTWIGKLKVTEKVEVEGEFGYSVYPNPLLEKTALSFYLEKNESVKVELYDALGQLVTYLFEGSLNEGYNELYLETANVAHGSYYLFLKGENGSKKFTAKLIK
jgi:hypothetical protein